MCRTVFDIFLEWKVIMKKTLAALTAFVMVFGAGGILPCVCGEHGSVILASAETNGDYKYKVQDDGTVKITKYKGSAEELTIPSKLDGKKVTVIENDAFSGCTKLKSVKIPAGVTRIGLDSFSGCTALTSVTLPDSMVRIEDYSFSECTNLTSINIPKGVTYIGGYAFKNTKWLENKQQEEPQVIVNGILIDGTQCRGSIVIPDGVTCIASWAFINCKTLTGVTIPDSVTDLGMSAFEGCTGLTRIKIPHSVTDISFAAFSDCTNLTGVTIPESVTTIEARAFNGCTSLKNITIPDSVLGIGWGAFMDCTSLKSITIPNNVIDLMDYSFGYSWNYDTSGCDKLSGIKIYCYKGSAGEKYAIDNGFDYEIITKKKTDIKGDISGDGAVTVSDISLLAAHVKGIKKLDEAAQKRADLNKDGAVNVSDISLLAAHVKGRKALS